MALTSPTGHAATRHPDHNLKSSRGGGRRPSRRKTLTHTHRALHSWPGFADTPVSDAHDAQLLRSPTRAPRSPGLRYGSADAPAFRWRWHVIDPGSRQSGLRSHGNWRSQHRRGMDRTGRETAGMPLPAAQDGIKAVATRAGEPFEVAGMRKLGQGALRRHPASSALTDDRKPAER